MRITTLVAITAPLLSWLACARSVPPPAGLAPGTPYITWIIMHGDSDNPDREFACQSTPRNDCELPASTPQAPVVSHVYLYYHGVGGETTYAGSVRLGFMRGAAPGGSRTNIVVKKNQSIANQSTTGIVTSTPGSYTMGIEFDAATNGGAKRPIRDDVSVTVK